MRFNDAYKLWELGNECIVIENSTNDINLSDVYKLNETSLFLWKSMGTKEFTEDDLIAALCREYEVELSLVKKDVKFFIEKMKSFGFII